MKRLFAIWQRRPWTPTPNLLHHLLHMTSAVTMMYLISYTFNTYLETAALIVSVMALALEGATAIFKRNYLDCINDLYQYQAHIVILAVRTGALVWLPLYLFGYASLLIVTDIIETKKSGA